MTLANLKEELRRKTSAQAEALQTEAEAEASRIRKDAHAQARQIVEAAKAEALEIGAKERTQISAAKLKARRHVQDARYGLVEEVISSLRDELSVQTENKRDYQKLLEALIKEGMAQVGKNSELRVRKEDVAFAKRFGDVGAPIETLGGVMVVSSDGRIKINSTFEALLESHDQAVKQRAFELLFK